MAKLVVAFLAIFAFAGGSAWKDVNTTDVVKSTRELIEVLKTDYNVHHLYFFKDVINDIRSNLKDRSLDDDNILELDNKLRELSTYLEAPKTMMQRMIECLEDVAKIFESFTFDLKVEDNSYQHTLLKEYWNALKRTCTMLKVTFIDFNFKLEVRNAVAEILEDLKTVNFDNVFVRRILAEHILNFSNEFEMVQDDEVLECIDCLKNSVNKKVDTPKSGRDLELCFRKLLTAIEKKDFEHSFEMKLLTAIRILEFNIYIACHTNFQHGETSIGFGLQIQTISTGLINTINSITLENENAQRILLDTTKEFINELEGLQWKIREESFKIKIDHHVQKLKHALSEMQYNAIQTVVIDAVQEITSEIRFLLHTNFDEALYEVCNDFLAILQRQLIQTQNIYQGTTYKQPIEKLARQIQTITNSALLYLRNVPTNDVMIREKLEVQVHHLVKKTQAALNRIGQVNHEGFLKVLDHLKRITVDFENFMDRTKMTSIKEVIFHFNILAQKIAINIKQLAWISSSSTDLSEIVKNMMSEYLVIIENIQVKIQRINQVAQVGESPKELAVQIEVTSEHLRKLLLVFMSDSLLANRTLMWQVRSFNEILEVIVDQLRFKIINQSAVIYREVAKNLKIIQKSLVTYTDDVKRTNFYKLRSILGNIIHESAMELQKLTSISQFDIQEGHGLQTTFVKGILMEFLLGLQDFHIQLQHNFQILLSEQSPEKMLIEIGTVSNSVLNLLQEPETNYEPILAIQLGEYVQTIENVLNLLHHRMKGIGSHDSEQERISDALGKISLILQNVDTKDIKAIRENLETAMFKFITTMQGLVKMNTNKIIFGIHTGVLHGILSNMLISLRNMYFQLQSTKQVQTYENNREILNHIAIISNNIMPALETIVGSTTPVKQALDIQVFKYARALKMLINKLDVRTDKAAQIILKEALMVLEQTGSSITTLTINDIKLHLNKLVQGIGVEIQKIDKRDILVDYIMTLKNLHVQIQSISRMSHQSENYQLIGMHIDTAVIELSNSLQNVRGRYEIVAKIISIESQEMEQIIGNIINRYQAASILQNNKLFAYIASQLKTIQLSLQDVTVKRATENFNHVAGKVTADMKRTATLIEQLMWIEVQETPTEQYRPDIATFIRVTLHDFLTAIQNMVIQIEGVVVRVEDDKFGLIRELSMRNNVKQNEFKLTVPMPPKPLENDYATTHLQNDSTKQSYTMGKNYMTRPMITDYRNSLVSRRHTIAQTYYKNNIMKSMYKGDIDQYSVQILKDAFEILKSHLGTEENIEKFNINKVLLLLEEIMELASADVDRKLFVEKLRDSYTNLKRMKIHQDYVNYNQMKWKILDCISIVIEAVEEFYTHVHLEGLDDNLLTLYKNWMEDFCIAIKQT